MTKSDETDRMRLLLIESITTLCRSGINYSESLKVEGLLAITIDEGDVMVVNVNKGYEVPGAKKPAEDDKVESGRSSPENEQCRRKNSGDSNQGVSSAQKRSMSQDSVPHKISRRDHLSTDSIQIEGSWSVSDSSRDSQSQSMQGHSQYASHPDHSQSYQHDPGSRESDKAEIKIEIMDSDSEDGESSLNLFDEFSKNEGQLVAMQGSDPAAMYSGSGYNQPVPGPSGATTFSQMLPTQTMGSPTVGSNLQTVDTQAIVKQAPPARKKARKPEHDAMCWCCNVMKRRRDMMREKYHMRKHSPGGMTKRREPLHYKRPDHHISVCSCCWDYQKLLDASKKQYNKQKNSPAIKPL